MKFLGTFKWIGGRIPAVLASAGIAVLVVAGQKHQWSIPSFGELIGRAAETAGDDWCREHNVPEAICIECQKDLKPAAKPQGWCKKHGVAECVFCHPELAQVDASASSPEITARAEEGLRLTERPANSSKCKLHLRRLQFADESVVSRLGIETAPASVGRVREFAVAPGETVNDPDRPATRT